MGIPESADPAQGREIVVERPVLLHQDDDVLDILDGAGAVGRGDGGGAGDAFLQYGGGDARSRDLEEAATIEVDHGAPSVEGCALANSRCGANSAQRPHDIDLNLGGDRTERPGGMADDSAANRRDSGRPDARLIVVQTLNFSLSRC
ncbi:hypothetical protein SDC9_137500 [bioreactor metagenome]|uniref:Uncharacterized protein n=1 Tax=bioreactor metagenome TaxID=1076179 RepID=A0A645DM60_9ZZZZ